MKPDETGRGVALPPARRLLCALLGWLVLYSASVTLYNVTYPVTREVMIHRMQVIPAYWILELTLPGVALHHGETTIRSPMLELNILRGCDGVEAWLLLVTALLVFPMPWRRRWSGVALGTLMIWSLNILRIVTLFHIGLKKMSWFDTAHGVVWQSLIVLAAAAFVLLWSDPGRTPPAASEPTT